MAESEVLNVSVLRLASRSEKHLCFKQEENMAKIKLNFVWKNSTPGTERYQEVDDAGQPRKTDNDGQVIGPIYLRKAALRSMGLLNVNGTVPHQFTVTIDEIK